MAVMVALAAGGSRVPANAASRAHSDMKVRLDPGTSRIMASVQTRIWSADARRQSFQLSANAKDLSVSVDGRNTGFTFSGTTLQVDIGQQRGNRPVTIQLAYTCSFKDPVPHMPINTDNPGYGVTATIGPKGTLLLAGSGWYPAPAVDRAAYRLQVEAPAGILAVTAGRLEAHTTKDGRTLSTWIIENPVRGLALSAARYQLRTRQVGKVTAATYFTEDSSHLSDSYLEAVAHYLTLYQDLFGPYPFDKFAVVENFFPTGYDFPSYTLLGGRVLRRPFIKYTSLGHEIAHCWWGNGVTVDYSQGNWSEGLTTYVADYLYKERQSAEAALDYRRQMLRNYASLVSAANEFSLSRFVSRTGPVSKTIGYDKAAMVFHMVRRQIGDPAFWATLQGVYKQHLFKAISWDDWRRAFEAQAGVALKAFFDQWVNGAGAPKPAFKGLKVVQADSGYLISGRILQPSPFFTFPVDIVLETRQGSVTQTIQVSGKSTAFQIQAPAMPDRLIFDPDVNLWRRLYETEIPPTVNSIKGSDNVTVIVAGGLNRSDADMASMLSAALGLQQVTLVHEDAVDLDALANKDLILFGRPKRSDLLAVLPVQLKHNGRQMIINNTQYSDSADVYFCVVSGARSDQQVVALFWPNDMRHAEAVARKITHYGRYSYLVFRNGRNIAKGTWPVTESPLIHNW